MNSLLASMRSRAKKQSDIGEWLKSLTREGDILFISKPKRFAHDETKYDEYYQSTLDLSLGRGLLNLLKEKKADFSGPALEVGCGTGILSVGLVDGGLFPSVILTDPSPVFLEIAMKKMRDASIDLSKTEFAVLMAEDIHRLPADSFSLIVLRSVLHHVSDVAKFLKDTARVLKKGGVFVCEEPCMEGFVLMGAMAQFIPLVAGNAGETLTDKQKEQIQLFVDTMHFAARRDIDKSEAEDKHLFRVDEIMKLGLDAGMTTDFYPNMTYQYFAAPRKKRGKPPSFAEFFHIYLRYCMSFEPALVDLIEKYFPAYCGFIDNLSLAFNGPYMNGIFVCRKA